MQTQGQKIKELINYLGMKAESFAERVDLHPSSLSRKLGREDDFPQKDLIRFARELGVKPEFIRDKGLEWTQDQELPAWAIDRPATNEEMAKRISALEQMIVEVFARINAVEKP